MYGPGGMMGPRDGVPRSEYGADTGQEQGFRAAGSGVPAYMGADAGTRTTSHFFSRSRTRARCIPTVASPYFIPLFHPGATSGIPQAS